MKIPNRPYQCPLGKAQPTPVNLDAIKKSGWQEQHILVVSDFCRVWVLLELVFLQCES